MVPAKGETITLSFNERELIKVVGEKEVPGRPYLYSTTELFLEVFSLNSIKDLPDIEEFAEYEKEAESEI